VSGLSKIRKSFTEGSSEILYAESVTLPDDYINIHNMNGVRSITDFWEHKKN
jgi:hypothetical protein